MTSIQIIECSKHNGVGENSDWRNTIANPLTVHRGDILQVKNVFIDTNANVSDNIVIAADTPLELKIGYYLINSHTPSEDDGKKFEHLGAGATKINYETYIARNGDASQKLFTPVMNTWTYTLKQGTYTASEIAMEITKAMTELEFKHIMPNSNESVNTNNPFLINTFNNSNRINFYKPSTTRAIYDAGNAPYFWFDTNSDAYARWWLGSQITSLIWNKEGSGRFEIVAHTPIIYEGQEVVNIHRNEANTHYNMFNRRMGVFFNEMKPASFWQDVLGFSDDLLVKFTTHADGDEYDLVHTDDLDKLGSKTTGGMISLTNCFLNPTKDGEASIQSNWKLDDPSGVDNYTATNGATYSIEAVKTYNPQADGAYYLVSISNFNNKYSEDTQTRKDIQAVVSRQYSTSNFITGYQQSGIDWENTGEPFLLSDVRISILDPKTKIPVDDLGTSSAVFLQLIHSRPKTKTKK